MNKKQELEIRIKCAKEAVERVEKNFEVKLAEVKAKYGKATVDLFVRGEMEMIEALRENVRALENEVCE